MTSDNGPKPTQQTVTFDSYVKPDTVREEVTPAPEVKFRPVFASTPETTPATDRAMPIDPTLTAIGVVGVLTFLLGVLLTLQFVGPDDTAPQLTEADPLVQVQAAVDDSQSGGDNAPEPLNLERAVNASLDEVVTRTNSDDLITPAGASLRPGVEALSMEEILLGLSARGATDEQATQETLEIISRNKLRMLREGVLAGVYSVKAVKRNGKDRLCLRMPNANVSQDEASEMIKQAAARGEIELPQSLSTPDGSFDADTLIFNLVQTSLANDGTEEGAAAARELSRRAFAASNAKTTKVEGERVYLVEPGDSLAYISLQFYGRPSDYQKIFQANRAILSSPDKIQIGQRLIIPG